MAQKYKGYAKAISGYGGQKFALFKNGKKVGESTMTTSNREEHKAELNSMGYRVLKGYVPRQTDYTQIDRH